MRAYHETLTGALRDKKQGNHAVWHFDGESLAGMKEFLDDKTRKWLMPDGITRVFTYHGNTICVVNDTTRQYWLSHAGWWTRSTNDALAGYRQVFSQLGYENANKIAVYNYEMER